MLQSKAEGGLAPGRDTWMGTPARRAWAGQRAWVSLCWLLWAPGGDSWGFQLALRPLHSQILTWLGYRLTEPKASVRPWGVLLSCRWNPWCVPQSPAQSPELDFVRHRLRSPWNFLVSVLQIRVSQTIWVFVLGINRALQKQIIRKSFRSWHKEREMAMTSQTEAYCTQKCLSMPTYLMGLNPELPSLGNALNSRVQELFWRREGRIWP